MDKRFQDVPIPLYLPQDDIEMLDETQQHRDVRKLTSFYDYLFAFFFFVEELYSIVKGFEKIN